MPVIATAGHVDHGKSTLVRTLTGMEPDRWAEERRRGLSIGLGFGWLPLPHGPPLAVVDVPGHERFLATMLTGLAGAQGVLFVVAADEGWMPQSAEHLAAAHALRIGRGVVAVTRADLADPGPVIEQTVARLAPTSLAGAPVVAVSARSGRGIDRLRAALTELAAGFPVPDRAADLRLWVDRSFVVPGAGTVVTGTLAAGTIRVGDEVVSATTGAVLRVRGLRCTGRPVTEAVPVTRLAVRLGVRRDSVERGDALLAATAEWISTEEVDVAFDGPSDPPVRALAHIGTTSVPVRVRPLGPGAARVRLTRRLPLRVGDRLLLRDPGRGRALVAALVLDVCPPPLTRRGAAGRRGAELTALADQPSAAVAAATVRWRGFVPERDLRAAGLPAAGVRLAGGWCADDAAWAELRGSLTEWVARWCAGHPLEPGPSLATAVRELALPSVHVLRELAPPELSFVDGRLRMPDVPGLPTPVRDAIRLLCTGLIAPTAGRLAAAGLGQRELAAAARQGLVLRLAPGVVLAPGADRLAARLLSGIPQPFTVSQARQVWCTTRRTAVPLLEHLDRIGVTERLSGTLRALAAEQTGG